MQPCFDLRETHFVLIRRWMYFCRFLIHQLLNEIALALKLMLSLANTADDDRTIDLPHTHLERSLFHNNKGIIYE